MRNALMWVYTRMRGRAMQCYRALAPCGLASIPGCVLPPPPFLGSVLAFAQKFPSPAPCSPHTPMRPLAAARHPLQCIEGCAGALRPTPCASPAAGLPLHTRTQVDSCSTSVVFEMLHLPTKPALALPTPTLEKPMHAGGRRLHDGCV